MDCGDAFESNTTQRKLCSNCQGIQFGHRPTVYSGAGMFVTDFKVKSFPNMRRSS